MTRSLLFFSLMLISFLAQGKVFSNSYISFELPPNWSCESRNIEWVCKSSNNAQAKQAIIVLTAKQVGPNDNFAYYNQYLKVPKTPKYRDGTVAASSKIQHIKELQIGNHSWIDSLHLGSLLPSFYSRYLVTTKDKLAILITFSAKKEFYAIYSRHFFDAITSLKTNSSTNYGGGLPLAMDDENTDEITDPELWNENEQINVTNNKSKNSNMLLYGVALLLVGLAAFFLIKRK